MEKGTERISKMLKTAHTDAAVFPPTILYNEGWMLRIILSLQSEGIECLPFTFLSGARWFSEALIGSPFLHRWRGDRLAENVTHLDGVIGHFHFRSETKAGLLLTADSKQFVIIEAKVYAHLSKGTTNAPDYDQAARSIACIAWAIKQSNRTVEDFESLGFYVIAPLEQINRGIFSSQVSKSSIKEKVERRISAYSGDDRKYAELQTWYEDSFIPTLRRIHLPPVYSWESAVDAIDEPDVREFYNRCLRFNARATRREAEDSAQCRHY